MSEYHLDKPIPGEPQYRAICACCGQALGLYQSPCMKKGINFGHVHCWRCGAWSAIRIVGESMLMETVGANTPQAETWYKLALQPQPVLHPGLEPVP